MDFRGANALNAVCRALEFRSLRGWFASIDGIRILGGHGYAAVYKASEAIAPYKTRCSSHGPKSGQELNTTQLATAMDDDYESVLFVCREVNGRLRVERPLSSLTD